MQNANLGWIQTCGGSIEKLSFLVTAMAKIPKRTAALFHQCYTPFFSAKRADFLRGGK